MVATTIASAILEGEDPRKFFRHISAKKRETEVNKVRTHTHPEPCDQWDEWEDLEEWMRIAAKEMEVALAAEFQLDRHDTLEFSISADDNHSYTVYENDDVAEIVAKDYCKQTIDDEPEIWSQSFLQQHINIERLKRDLAMDLNYSEKEMLDEQYPDFTDKRDVLIKDGKLDEDDFHDENGYELDETPELAQLVDSAWETYCEEYVENILKDPMSYLEDIFGEADAVKKAIEIGGIDADAAAQEAVNVDGWQHFLARYDGNSHDLPGGAVYVRT